LRLATFKDSGGTSHAYSYDAGGNPTSIGNQFSALAYDALGHLRQVVYAQTDNYSYNDAGLRVKKTENATGAWKSTYTLYEGDNPLLQEVYTAAGRIQTTYNVIVDGKILAQYKTVYPSTLSVAYFYLDNLGSRRVAVSSGGSAIDRYRYSAWGKSTPRAAESSDNTGHWSGSSRAPDVRHSERRRGPDSRARVSRCASQGVRTAILLESTTLRKSSTFRVTMQSARPFRAAAAIRAS
jgi:hypothetical protein